MPRTFRQSLVLHQWLLEQVAAPVWERDSDVNRRLKAAETEAWGEESPFLHVLLEERSHIDSALPDGVLRRLDADIVALTRQLGVSRWMYFQYIAMLFSGIYLDTYFADRDRLLKVLNGRVAQFNADAATPPPRRGRARQSDDDKLTEYTTGDLSRLGCWQATGSGKTLLLHAHRAQVLVYSKQYEEVNRRDRPDAPELLPPERTILICPNRLLVEHHIAEADPLHNRVDRFEPGLPMSRLGGKGPRHLLGASISQFTAPGGKQTAGKVPPEFFVGRNLVLVDEGHRGSSNVDSQWRAIREALATGGFLIEYSATLEQAAKGELRNYYAKSIFIDYSYPKFYGDGYGKHHRILNLVQDRPESRHDYLVAATLAFHQQLDVFEQHEVALRAYNIERPLLLFAGRTVTGETKKDEEKLEKVEDADVVKLLRFLAVFVAGFDTARPMLQAILDGKPGLLTRERVDLFANYFPEVVERDPEALYKAMLKRVFRATAPGRLTLEVLKDAQGEIGLKVGDGDFFGVINVGSPDRLVEKVEKGDKENRIRILPNEFRGGLFAKIKERDNRLTMLIGSKKFAEGWSSWRVSQIGLLHIGKGEGTQVIQLFGRGVRLKGKGGSLKRTSPAWSETVEKGTQLSQLRIVETLNVFAIEADYLKRFEEQIGEMVKDDEDERVQKELPVIRDERAKGRKLRVPVPPPQREFVQNIVLSLDPAAKLPDGIGPGAPLHITDDLTPRVQVAGDAGSGTAAEPQRAHLDLVRAFVNHDALYSALVEMKNRKGWTNLSLPRLVQHEGKTVPLTAALLADSNRYTVYLPPRYVEPEHVHDLRYLGLWEEIGRRLVTKYADKLYRHCLGRWQTLNARCEELEALDADVIAGMYPPGWLDDTPHYDVMFVKDSAGFEGWLGQVEGKVRQGTFKKEEHPSALGFFAGTKSIYHPLLYRPARAKVDVRVRPVALVDSEARFVEKLHQWLASAEGQSAVGDAEVFLLRNFSRTGLGFFVGRGFYPDFIVWVLRGAEQWVTFVDPKGLHHSDGDRDGKVQLAKDLRDVEGRMTGSKTHLDSWLWSVTPRNKLAPGTYEAGFLANHVLFDEDAGAIGHLFDRSKRP